MQRNRSRSRTHTYRYGIGEWYGQSFVTLTPERRRELGEQQALPKRDRPVQPCLPRTTEDQFVPCTKAGGVCSLRLYQRDRDTDTVFVAPPPLSELATTCPYRFYEEGWIFKWIGETLLGHPEPRRVKEVGFLEREPQAQEVVIEAPTPGSSPDDPMDSTGEDVGRIDNILVHPSRAPLHWCAMEIQAVYFSGDTMGTDFRAIAQQTMPGLPFPAGQRRPDFRSSGPKRLMPQLQIKVPSLRRWGKKMAVLIDRSFFNALGRMESVPDVSNSDIAWFVVAYTETDGVTRLIPDEVRFTTLERAVEGLTAGRPVSLDTFEERIHEKLRRGGFTP